MAMDSPTPLFAPVTSTTFGAAYWWSWPAENSGKKLPAPSSFWVNKARDTQIARTVTGAANRVPLIILLFAKQNSGRTI